MDSAGRAEKAASESELPIAAKAALRKHVKAIVAALAPGEKDLAAQAARCILRTQPVWQKARSILFFAPRPDELDLWPLLATAIEERKTAVLPRYNATSQTYTVCQVHDPARDLCVGKFNIREPVARCAEVALNWLDLILVPGVAFDLHGRRLGRGKGFYDQLLKTVRGTTCGIVFDEQIVREVPVEPHDIHLNCLLTPTRWIEL